jgi:hypothetical protein
LAADFAYIDYPEESGILPQPAYFVISTDGLIDAGIAFLLGA